VLQHQEVDKSNVEALIERKSGSRFTTNRHREVAIGSDAPP
jgi:hypothetical protein